MLKNYLKIAWRNLWKNRFYSTVNIAGLTVGLTVGMLVFLWVKNEFGHDRFHRDTKNIYRILSNMGSGDSRQIWSNSHAPIATFAKREVPEIREAVRIRGNWNYSIFRYGDTQFTETNKCYVDPSFFTFFDFKLIKGNPESPFQGDHSVILTASTAKRYFGEEDPIGKVLQANNKEFFEVTGILEDFPENSSIRYDMLFPMDLYAKLFTGNGEWKTIEEDWGNFMYTTFLKLNPETATAIVEDKLAQVLRNNYRDIGIDDPYTLQPLANMHLYKTDGSEGLMQIVRIFLIVGMVILVIACINYVNLSTARSMLRAKEVSLRKIVGAGKDQLFAQFIVETVMVFFFVTVLSLLLVYLLMPVYNVIAGKNMVFRLTDPSIWAIVGVTVLSTLTLSGIYPSLLLSSFDPLKAMKGKLSTGISANVFRKTLVITQFVFSTALIFGTMIIEHQLNYIQEKELGYDKEHVFTFEMREMQPHAPAVKAELMKHQGVKGVTCTNDDIVHLGGTTGDTDWDGKAPGQAFFIHPLTIDEDFLSVLKLELVEGEGFTGIASDSAHYILNETAVKEAGITDPVGQRFRLWDTEGTIIGVVRDFHFASLKQRIEPAIFRYHPENYGMYVKTTGKDAPAVLSEVEKLWKQYNADFPFEYTFLDDTYDNLYKAEQRIGMLFKLFSFVAIFISCLGLFGLAAYIAQVKTKEIGIRKVLGASVTGIIGLLSKDFIKLVLAAIIIASPIAWWAMSRWLADFAYRIDIEWWMFGIAGLMAVVIALLTVSFQSVKAALANPVESLRSE
ncbi:ABC transporter permease [Negadavirga shengliensis]|uniref:ABC transporter permease n=1 Tax=Negadavirga shengliensis TaxID=1389218 RepID=A0ABV9T766_9BACT